MCSALQLRGPLTCGDRCSVRRDHLQDGAGLIVEHVQLARAVESERADRHFRVQDFRVEGQPPSVPSSAPDSTTSPISVHVDSGQSGDRTASIDVPAHSREPQRAAVFLDRFDQVAPGASRIEIVRSLARAPSVVPPSLDEVDLFPCVIRKNAGNVTSSNHHTDAIDIDQRRGALGAAGAVALSHGA
jgi:hypothetical protein